MKKNILLLTFLLSGSLLFGQNNSFNFEFDYAQFGYDSVSNYVEVYYSFNQASLKPKITDSASYIDGVLRVLIIDTLKNDTTINREWRVTHQLVDTVDIRTKSLLGVVGFVIPAGNYRSEISGYDFNNPTRKKEIKESSLMQNGNSIRTFASNDEAFLDLKTGRLDAILMDNYAGRYYISNINKDENLYSVISGEFGDSFAGVGIRKEDSDLKTIIDLALDELKTNGTAKTISIDWFGADLIAK